LADEVVEVDVVGVWMDEKEGWRWEGRDIKYACS
jgi:hypothetical protein